MPRQTCRISTLCGTLAFAILASACSPAVEPEAGAPAPAVAAFGQTAPSEAGGVAAGVAVLDGGDVRIVTAAGLGGLDVQDLGGARLGGVVSGEIVGADVSYGYMLNGQSATILAAVDITQNGLRFFEMKGAQIVEVGARTVPLGFAAEGVCLFHNSLDGALYAFVVGDGGELDQQLIYTDASGRLDARQVRRLNVMSTLNSCVVDSASATVYASEESVGIWRFNANPEAFAAPSLVDGPRFGKITEEAGGLALHDGQDGARWLIASDPMGGRLNIYDRSKDDAYAGSVVVSTSADGKTIGEPGRLFGFSHALKDAANGLLLVTDEDAAAVRMVSIADIAAALNVRAGASTDPRIHAGAKVPTVMATVETRAVDSFGDAADDPAIWADPANPSRSLVVATDKKGGLFVHDMQGRVVQDLRDGKMNNVDLRDGFRLGGESVILVAASNRTDRTIALYRLDPATRRLKDIADGPQATGLDDPYGLCLSRNPATGRTHVFVNGDDTRKRQWEIVDAGNGRVRAQFVREFAFAGQTEGCVADDETGVLYVNEEDAGLWRMSVEPGAEAGMTSVQRIADNPAVKDDFEGVGLYDLGGGRGYLVVSSQGNDTYAVYRREGDQAYLGSFAVAANAALGIDGISETDGLDVTSRNLGPGFEHGAMVAQDGRNVLPVENQNYKYVPWQAIAEALKLDMRQ